MFKKIFTGAALTAILGFSTHSSLQAAPLQFSFDNVKFTEILTDVLGNTTIYHVGSYTVLPFDAVSGIQQIEFNVGNKFSVGIPDSTSGNIITSADLNITYDVDPGNIGFITSIHSYAIKVDGSYSVLFGTETVTADQVDYFIDPVSDSEVHIPATDAVHVVKDLELFGKKDAKGSILPGGVSTVVQGVDTPPTVPEPAATASFIGLGVMSCLLQRRRRS